MTPAARWEKRVGIACIGAITAGVAAWLVAQVEADARGREEPITERP
jgi:hypothetical protein